jgi:lycopene cyclase domain-containing protein
MLKKNQFIKVFIRFFIKGIMEYLMAIGLFFFIALFVKLAFKLKIYDSWEQGVFITIFFFFVGILADSFAVWRGYWGFHEPGILGIYLGFLPIEEYFLFLVAPFFGITMYKLFKQRLR